MNDLVSSGNVTAMWWPRAQDRRRTNVRGRLFDVCEHALSPDDRIGDDPQVVMVMSPMRVQAINATNLEGGRKHFDWKVPGALLLTESRLVCARDKFLGGPEVHVWMKMLYSKHNLGSWGPWSMVELLSREGGTLTFGFQTPAEMEEMSAYLLTRYL